MNYLLIMNNYTIGVFDNSDDLYQALKELKDSDFPDEQISVVVRSPSARSNSESIKDSTQPQQYSNYAGEGTRSGAVSGSVVGSVLGLLVGTGLVAIPFVGPIMLSEAALTAIATAIAGSGIGVASGGILGHIIGFGIQRNASQPTPEQNPPGQYLLIVNGDKRNIQEVNWILSFQSEYWTNYKTLSSAKNVIHPNNKSNQNLTFQYN